MNSSQLSEELSRFIGMTGVPAAAAGIIDRQGNFQMECAGQCARDDPAPVGRDDQWHIGSCNKSITATLFGLLVENSKIDWQSTLAEVFADCHDVMHADWFDITFDELFYCRSGMPANPSLATTKASWQDQRPFGEQRTDLIRNVLAKPPNKRGKFRYSNLGYITIGGAIDRVAGMSYEAALQNLLFNPLGVSSAGFGAPPRIKGHSSLIRSPWINLFKGKACDPSLPASDNPAVFSSAGTLHLSLPDWARYLAEFLENRKQPVISDAVINAVMEAPPDYFMTRGMGRVDSPIASFAVQGSNTMWVATAMFSKERDRISLIACNDGRSRLLSNTAQFAMRLLELPDHGNDESA
ncbi:MAG: serine hydrolase [Granulosicoccus sp.]|nr:serine hydrolase [Granulosicoccus sp.]